MIIVKISFVVLLCIPIACVSFFLLEKLLDEYISVNKKRKKTKERAERIENYRKKRHRSY